MGLNVYVKYPHDWLYLFPNRDPLAIIGLSQTLD